MGPLVGLALCGYGSVAISTPMYHCLIRTLTRPSASSGSCSPSTRSKTSSSTSAPLIPLLGASLLPSAAFLPCRPSDFLCLTTHSVAGATFVRSLTAFALPLVAALVFERLDWGGGGSLFGGLSIVALPCPALMFYYGPRLRERYKPKF
jgi:hypothetical protein